MRQHRGNRWYWKCTGSTRERPRARCGASIVTMLIDGLEKGRIIYALHTCAKHTTDESHPNTKPRTKKSVKKEGKIKTEIKKEISNDESNDSKPDCSNVLN